MRAFTYQVPSSIQKATSDFGQDAEFIAGGTTLIDLMKLEVMTPSQLVDINATTNARNRVNRGWSPHRCAGKDERCGGTPRGSSQISSYFPSLA